jgi:hypothetical protein
MYWKPFGGRDNGVWADTWVILADIETAHVTAVLDLLGEAELGAYVATPRGQKPRASGRHHLYVDLQQYHRAEDVLMLFLRGKEPRPEGVATGAKATRTTDLIPQPRPSVIAAVIKQLIVNHAVRTVVSVVIYAGLIGLAMTIAYYTGPVFHPTVHSVPYQLPAATP